MNDPLKGRYDLIDYLNTNPSIEDLRAMLEREQNGLNRLDMVRRLLGRIHSLEKAAAYTEANP